MAQAGPITTASVRPALPSCTMSSTIGACHAWNSGGTALSSLVGTTCISRQYHVSWQLVSSLETGMVIGMGHSQMPLDHQGHSTHLLGWGCGPPSGYWFQVSTHLGHPIWCPLTWKQWLWIETPDEFIQFGCKGPCKKLRKTSGLAITMSYPWWVRDLFICHQWIPSQMWGHFLPGKRYSPAFLNHQLGNSRDGHEPPTAPCCWTRHLGSCHFFLGPPRDARNVTILRDAEWIGGLTKVMIYPMGTNLHWKIAVLVTPIQGPMDTGWRVTWLPCKQLKQTNSGYPR